MLELLADRMIAAVIANENSMALVLDMDLFILNMLIPFTGLYLPI
jgi:hypothetical protein